MFNTTNCAEGWSRDNLMFAAKPNLECELNIAAFNALVAIFFTIQLSLFLLRSHYIISRARMTKKPLIFSQYFTMLTSFVTAVCVGLILLVPNVWGMNHNNVMVVLFGLELFIFQIILLRWVEKLRRLNFRIILKQIPEMRAMLNLGSKDLENGDKIIFFSVMFSRLLALCVLLFVCVLAAVFPLDQTNLRVGLGLMSVFLFVMASCSVFQAEQCCRVIFQSSKTVQQGALSARGDVVAQKYASVVRKFRIQQVIMGVFGAVAAVLCMFAASTGLILNNILYIVAIAMDACGSAGMVSSLLIGSCSRQKKQPSTPSGGGGGGIGGGGGSKDNDLMIRQLGGTSPPDSIAGNATLASVVVVAPSH